MAKTGAVWGIDLGQCALKALRCRAGDTPDTIVAEGFDYVEYPKMLGQPDANPAELIKEALETFPLAQLGQGRSGGHLRFRSKRLGAVHQTAAG